ncbi:hypothetical protein U5903_22165 [Cereibacter johrii]|uniref:hypothetical protein n=1 Tax=Cereibacter johrii TaxID=445629 RepID=UPI002B1F6F2F|nr:hypothetical protein [Cereibacter johrii]MEA5163486.1 hypothetical protein [Cereibacter johrii]
MMSVRASVEPQKPMAKNGHGVAKIGHATKKRRKIIALGAGRAFGAKCSRKAFICKGLKAMGSLLRQVCPLQAGEAAVRLPNRGLLALAVAGGCLLLDPCPVSAEAWKASAETAWASGSSFSPPADRRQPGPGSSFLEAQASSSFALVPKAPRQKKGRAFVMPTDRDEFVRIRALVHHAESSAAGYDDYHRSAPVPPPRPPSTLTLDQIREWIAATPGQQHAIGRYQIIPATLESLAARAAIPGSTLFSAPVQDSMASILILDAGYVELKNGAITLDRFMDNLARIWAGFPMASGKSAYEGVAGNKATISRKFYAAQMAEIFPVEARRDLRATEVAAK